MKNQFHKTNNRLFIVFLIGSLFLVFGLVFSLVVQPVQSSPQAQATTPSPTVTTTGTATTTVPTLPPPVVTGTPTVLVPVTGAVLAPPGQTLAIAVRIFVGLFGLFLVGYGIRAYRQGRQ